MNESLEHGGIHEDLRIISGRAHPELTAAVCRHLHVQETPVRFQDFPNENIFVQLLKSIRSKDTFIIQPLSSPVNQNIMELLILLDTCKRASPSRITAVIPYYAYGRSDKKDLPRVPITARLLADLIGAAGANRVMAIDLHAQQIQGFFSIPMDEITALRILTKEFEDRSKAGTLDLANTVIVSPDIGAAKRARDMAGMLGIRRQFAIIDKRRDKETSEVTALAIIGDVAGKTAIVIDEEISTGGSMVEAARILKDRGGAKEVYAACTHAVFCGKVVENFDKLAGELADPTTNPSRFAFREIVVTDTLPLTEKQKPTMIPIKPVTIAPFLGDVIKCIHLGGSLGELLGDEHDRSD